MRERERKRKIKRERERDTDDICNSLRIIVVIGYQGIAAEHKTIKWPFKNGG